MGNHNKDLLMIFTRNPELGKVKTRLAAGMGDEAALAVYKVLLDHTQKVTKSLPHAKSVWYSVQIRENDIWNPKLYDKYQQQGNDLGQRMQMAFEEVLTKGYQKVIIIGSDLYDLQEKHIEEAFARLEDHEVVIGPAKDGGYYLLGMKTLIPAIFKNKGWGKDKVLEDTLQDLKNHQVFLLEELNDIDFVQDLEGYKEFEKFVRKP